MQSGFISETKTVVLTAHEAMTDLLSLVDYFNIQIGTTETCFRSPVIASDRFARSVMNYQHHTCLGLESFKR